MQTCRLLPSRECPDALERLYEIYRVSLPASKQTFVSTRLSAGLLVDDGLVCFQGERAVAALLWRLDREMPINLATADFYAESSEATLESIEILIEAFLRKIGAGRAIQFELWIGPEARIHDLLRQHRLRRLERSLLSLSSAPCAPAEHGDIQLISVSQLPLTEPRLAHLGQALCRAYAGTVDGQFYTHYRTAETCCAYLSQVINSPGCNTRHSWLAIAGETGAIMGAALCQSWPRGRALYLEQLFVDPCHHGRGVGRKLLLQAACALAQGAARQLVWTVSRENRPAMSLYQSLGASELSAECAYALAPEIPAAPVIAS